ncbi:hypothetical protein DFH27DRAFT_614690 [Peziza echinospora]|nr:hypothetical protein DFH27DRAFT_614690 [Peziza echinospora]
MPTINGRRREATEPEKIRIIELAAQGKSHSTIACEIGCSKSSIQKIMQNYFEIFNSNSVI